MRKINGVEVVAGAFAYDGCHKIYLLNDEDSIVDAEENNGYDVYDIGSIISAFVYSCPLRFIGKWGGAFESVVPQCCCEIVFEGFKIPDDLQSCEYDIDVSEDRVVLKTKE